MNRSKSLLSSVFLGIVLLPGVALALHIESVTMEKVAEHDARVSWLVNPYTSETESFLYLRKAGNRQFRKMNKPGSREIAGGNYRTFLKGLMPATTYQVYVGAHEPSETEEVSPLYTLFTPPHINLTIEKGRAIVAWKLSKNQKGYVRYAPTLNLDTPWIPAMRATPDAPTVGVILAPLDAGKGYQYQVQIKSQADQILYTSDTALSFTAE